MSRFARPARQVEPAREHDTAAPAHSIPPALVPSAATGVASVDADASAAASSSVPPVSARPSARSRFARGFRALQMRNYRLFWFGQLVSLTGSWMQTTAQAWLVLQLTSSPLPVGLVSTLQFLPMTLLTLFGGVLADRLPKYRVVLLTQFSAMLLALVFGTLVLTGSIQLWHIYLLAMLQGCINAVDNPVRQAFMVELVGPQHLVNAVALNSMAFNGSRILGPAAAGLVIATLGIAPALYMNAASFLAVLAGLLLMNPAAFFSKPAAARAPVLRQLMEGLGYVWRTPKVMAIMIMVAAIGAFGYNFSVIMPLLGGFVLHTEAGAFGGLSAFLGLGSLLAALSIAYSGKLSLRRLLAGALGFSLLLGLVGQTRSYQLAALLLVGIGFGGIIFASGSNTLIQLAVPDALRGRVMSLFVLLFAGSTPIGALVIGVLSEQLGVPATLLACAGLCLAGIAVAFVYMRRHGVSLAPSGDGPAS